MKHVVSILGVLLAVAGGAEESGMILDKDAMRFLREMTAAVLEASRVPPGVSVAGIGPNTTGAVLIRPGGRNAYPAFWIRDYAMSLESDLIPLDEQRHALLLTAAHQVDEETLLPSGSVLPPGAIPDHISFGGVPIYFPGILEDYEAQGGTQWGKIPCLDDHFFFVHMAAQYVRQAGASGILSEQIKGKPLIQRLEAAYAMPPSHAESRLVFTTEENRGVNFGFFDTVVHTGDLLFCSVLKYRAAHELAGLFDALGNAERAAHYRDEAVALSQAIEKTFATDSGWLRAATGLSAQYDVWGTAFAVYTGAVGGDAAQRAAQALADALRAGTIAWRGAIRHVPTDVDFGPNTAWERAYAQKNRYQNGAYWSTPVGWVCFAVAKTDQALAASLVNDFIAELREGDFRKGPAFGSPWECVHEEDEHRQNPVYLTSVSVPLAVFQRMFQP